jgi:uncharacterized protein (DUF1778 family)
MKTKWFNFRISDKEKADLERLAAKEGRSVANFIMWLVRQHAKRVKK